jgi:signal transduction histidine kinase
MLSACSLFEDIVLGASRLLPAIAVTSFTGNRARTVLAPCRIPRDLSSRPLSALNGWHHRRPPGAPINEFNAKAGTLADRITADVDDIVDEWEQFARSSIAPAADLSPEELRDHARLLLLAVAADLNTAQDEAERHDKSRGDLPGNSPQITATAHEHAQHRFEQRFTLDEMLSEIRALRASVLRRWVERDNLDGSDAVGQLIRFGEAMDQALTESVAFFGAKVDQSRGLLLGVLGHDIRTPLGAVRLSAQMLQRTQGLDERQAKAVGRILSSSDTMRTMVDDLLDFTQTSLGTRLPISRAACDLRAVCTEAVAELQALHPDRAIELRLAGDLAGQWDASRVGQMLSNLVSNALHHGDPQQPVTIVAAGGPHDVTLDVHNRGRPIRAESRGTLFEPMGQSRDMGGDRHSGSSGLGLGLYIAREIALAHGGSLDVVSSAAHGTTFTALLHRQSPSSDR